MTKYLILFLLKLKILLLIFKKSTKTQTGGSLRRTEVSLLSPLLGLLTSIFHDWCQAAKDGTDLCQIHISQVWQSQCWRRGQKSGIHRLWKRGLVEDGCVPPLVYLVVWQSGNLLVLLCKHGSLLSEVVQTMFGKL